jgi:hypothetical protein
VHINRGLVFWGVALITAGVVALAIQSGTIPAETAQNAWRFWPVVLIVIGLAIVAARTPIALVATLVAGLVVGGMAGTLVSGFPGSMAVGCGGEPDASVTEEGTFAETASVELEFNCGDLVVSTGAGTDWRVDARYAGGSPPDVRASDGALAVSADDSGVFGFAERRQEWDVVLPTETAIDLSVDANAVSSRLDLGDADLTGLQVDANAGEVRLALAGASVDDMSINANAGSIRIDTDGSTTVTGSVELNAGSLELCVPESAGVAITIDDENITFSHDLDESGLSRQGDTWRSEGDAAITLNVSGNAASFSFNPEDGCS